MKVPEVLNHKREQTNTTQHKHSHTYITNMSSASQILAQRRGFYTDKLKSFVAWSTTKCSMNGTSDKYIRNMLGQMLKELHISSTMSPSIINTTYLQGFDATRLVNLVYKSCGPIFDVLSKDEHVRQTSVESALSSLQVCKVHLQGLRPMQLAGMCIFVQFILCGGRNDFEGFGVSVDLVEKWKKSHQQKNKKIQEEKMKEQAKLVQQAAYAVVDEEEGGDATGNGAEETKTEIDIPDSWEDL